MIIPTRQVHSSADLKVDDMVIVVTKCKHKGEIGLVEKKKAKVMVRFSSTDATYFWPTSLKVIQEPDTIPSPNFDSSKEMSESLDAAMNKFVAELIKSGLSPSSLEIKHELVRHHRQKLRDISQEK